MLELQRHAKLLLLKEMENVAGRQKQGISTALPDKQPRRIIQVHYHYHPFYLSNVHVTCSDFQVSANRSLLSKLGVPRGPQEVSQCWEGLSMNCLFWAEKE